MWTRILTTPGDEWEIRVAEIETRTVGFAMSGPSTRPDGQASPSERQLFTIQAESPSGRVLPSQRI